MRCFLTLVALLGLTPLTGRAVDPPVRPTRLKTEMPGVWVEVYTDRAAFDARLGKVSVVNFDDIAQRGYAVSFEPNHYKQKSGIVITGAGGQMAQGMYWGPKQFPPKSKPNTYAPGPRDRSGHGEGGFETRVTFDRENKPGAVAGFGTVFIAANQPKVWPCSLMVFGAGGKRLGVEAEFPGASGAQIFRGIVTVDEKGTPTAAIQKVLIHNSTGWPESRGVYGVTMDDFAFSPPVLAELPSTESDPNRPIKDRLARVLEWKQKRNVTQDLAENMLINLRIMALGLEKSLQELAEAEKAFPNAPELFECRGNAYWMFRQIEKSNAEYEKALTLKPRELHEYVTRGRVLANLERWEDALKSYNEAIRLDPKFAGSYADRAQTLENLNKVEEALADTNRAIELDPDYKLGYFNRACHLVKLKRYEPAIADYTRAIEVTPTPAAQAYWFRGLAYHELNKRQAAMDDVTTAIELFPKSAAWYEARAKFHRELGQPHRASQDLRRAVELGGGKPDPAKGKKGNPSAGNNGPTSPKGKGKH